MKRSVEQSEEQYRELARRRIITGDLFDYLAEKPVIPIKTEGESYGPLSRYIQEQGIEIPDLRLGEARHVDPFILVALWTRDSKYEAAVGPSAAACMGVASQLGLKRLVWSVGGRDRSKHLWRIERALEEKADLLEEKGLHSPDWIYVTEKELA